MRDMDKEGLGLSGLDTLIRAAFLRPVQIMRQSISNPGMVHSPIDAYHANQGLSSMPQYGTVHRRYLDISIGITNPYVLISGYGQTKVWQYLV